MIPLAVSSVAQVVIGIAFVYLVLNVAVADYGRSHGYPFLPLLIAGLFIGFPFVLLAVAIASRHRTAYMFDGEEADPAENAEARSGGPRGD